MKFSALIIITLFSFNSFAGFEVGLGINAGFVDFTDTTTTPEDNYSSLDVGFHLKTRAIMNFESLALGITAGRSWNNSAQSKGAISGSTSTYAQTYYGPSIGYIVNGNARINLEYYPYASHKYTYADDVSANYFKTNDEILGKGYGAGVTVLDGGFFYEFTFQVFTPDTVTLSEIEVDTGDPTFDKVGVNMTKLSMGMIF